jgi:nucleoid-associated protein YgaU
MRLLRLLCPELDVDISVTMGGAPATPVAGFAGWEDIERAEGKALTDRASVAPFEQEVPVFLDGYRKDNSVQGQLAEILKLGGEDGQPFRAFGPIHRPGIRFVFGGEPDFGDAIRDDDGRLLRQELTLKLKEYVPPAQIHRKRKRRRLRRGVATYMPGNSTYVVAAGENLYTITGKLYGDPSRWREIGRKNGIRDPFRTLPAGRVLKL